MLDFDGSIATLNNLSHRRGDDIDICDALGFISDFINEIGSSRGGIAALGCESINDYLLLLSEITQSLSDTVTEKENEIDFETDRQKRRFIQVRNDLNEMHQKTADALNSSENEINEIEKLKIKQDAEKQQLEAKLRELYRVKEEYNEKNAEKLRLSNELDSLTQEVNKLSSSDGCSVESLKREIAEKRTMLNDLNARAEVAKAEAIKADHDIFAAKQRLSDAAQLNESKQQSLDSINSEIEELMKKASEADSMKLSLSSGIEQAKLRVQEKEADIFKLKNDQDKLDADIYELTKEKEALTNAKSERLKRFNDIAAQTEPLRAENKKAECEIDEAMSTLTILNTQKEQLDNRLAEVKNSISSASEDISFLETECDSLAHSGEDSLENLEKKRKELSVLKDELISRSVLLEKNIAALESTCAEENDAVSRLNSDILLLTEKKEKLVSDKNDSIEKKLKTEKDIGRLKTEINDIKDEINRIVENSPDEQDLADQKLILSDLMEQNDDKNAKRAAIEEQIRITRQSISECSVLIEQSEAKLKEKDRNYSDLQTRIVQLDDAMKKMEKKTSESEERFNALNEEYDQNAAIYKGIKYEDFEKQSAAIRNKLVILKDIEKALNLTAKDTPAFFAATGMLAESKSDKLDKILKNYEKRLNNLSNIYKKLCDTVKGGN